MNIAIGIDNGVSGSVAVITDVNVYYTPIPTIVQQNYTKKKENISRVDFSKLYEFLFQFSPKQNGNSVMCLIERPMVNPGRFKATVSAIRALECTLNVIELLGIPYAYIDSKEWQKKFLPQGVVGSETKKYSMDIGKRFFPFFSKEIEKQKDADAFLIAKYCQMKYFTNL